MNTIIKRLGIIFSIFFSILLFSTISNAADLRLRKLDYQVQLNEDGSADIIENWRIAIEDTNTLFKTFEVDASKYKEITNVQVTEINNSTRRAFTKIDEEKYHVDKNCYYALMNKNHQFEIAWGVHAEDVTKTYEIKYKVIDVVKNYQDCSEFYWQFINTKSDIPAKIVTGTIKLPKSVSQKEQLKVWAHGPLNGNIQIQANDTVFFEVQDLKARTMLEARVVTPTDIFPNNTNVKAIRTLDTILSQEQEWANQANAKREAYAREQQIKEKILEIASVVLFILGIAIGILVIVKIIKYHKQLKQLPKMEPEQKIQYFRDIPDETYTPAQAAFLYYFKTYSMQTNMSKIISATMLDLCMKKYLSFEVMGDKKEKITIVLKQSNISSLPRDEAIVYEILQKIANKETNSFTMKDFEKYANKHASSLLQKFNEIESQTKQIEEQQGNYESQSIKEANSWKGKGVAYILLVLVSFLFMYITSIPAIIAAVYCFKISGRYNRLTQKGTNLKEQWEGLKRYMEDFSRIDEKSVPELVLWEKYLVFATTFGIADKVLKQLKVIYPQITDIDYMTSHGYAYMYLMYSHNLNHSFIHSLDTAVSSTYTSMNYSSGSGSGGGFSGGGGFGGGGGRNGRQIIKIRSRSYSS